MGVSDPVFLNGHVADAWGGDLSAFYRAGGGWKTGFMIRNVNEANMALGSEDRDPVPRSWNWASRESGITMPSCWRQRASASHRWKRACTRERNLVMGGRVGMRAGGGYGERDYRRVTAGLSYRMSLLQLDYGFMVPFDTVQGTLGTQQLSLILRFGRSRPSRFCSPHATRVP